MNKFCIIGTGRSGSSMLANILALSGADFSITPSKEWDMVRGDMEHALAHKAYSYIHKIRFVEESFLPASIFLPYYKRKLNKILFDLGDIQYIKSSKLVYVVPELAKKNQDIKVIIVYRNFNDYAKSRHAKYGWDMNRMRNEYINAYSTSILQLSIWGGVVVSYNDLTDVKKNEWAESLGALTGLDKEELIRNRDEIVKEPTIKKGDNNICFDDVLLVQDKLKALTNSA